MTFSNKSLDSLTEADLQALLDSSAIDLRTIEFRPNLPDETLSAEQEFLHDVASFANAVGGDLIYGIEQDKESRTLIGLPMDEAQAGRSRLEKLIQDGIEPILQGVQMRYVGLENSRSVMVIRIPQSWDGPCWVKLGDSYRFFSRTTMGRYALGYHELRDRLISSESRLERLRRFRLERLGRILAGETTVALQDAPKTVLHVFPLSAFTTSANISLSTLTRLNPSLHPFASGHMGIMYNVDGLYVHDGLDKDEKTRGYFQVFRNGCIEVVGTSLTDIRGEKRYIASEYFEAKIIEALADVRKLYELLTIDPPFLVMLSVLGVKGYRMAANNEWGYYAKLIDRDDLILPEMIIEEADFDAATVLQSVFDLVWNAAGYEKSENYDENGKRRRR